MLYGMYFFLWLIFNGRVTIEVCVFGLVIAGIMLWFTCKFMGYSMELERKIIKKLPVIAKLLGIIFIEVTKSNLEVIHWIYQRGRVRKPVMVLCKIDLKKTFTQVIMADCITITPGTMTGLQEGNNYMIHCLDESMSDGLDVSAFVDILQKLEE